MTCDGAVGAGTCGVTNGLTGEVGDGPTSRGGDKGRVGESGGGEGKDGRQIEYEARGDDFCAVWIGPHRERGVRGGEGVADSDGERIRFAGGTGRTVEEEEVRREDEEVLREVGRGGRARWRAASARLGWSGCLGRERPTWLLIVREWLER